MPRLTPAKKEDAKVLAKELFEIDVMAEKQMAIVRYVDQAKVAEAHAAISKGRPPVGSLPPQDRMQDCIDYTQQELEKLQALKNPSLVDRMMIVTNALFLARVKLLLAGENDHFFTLEIIKHRNDMHTQYRTTHGFYGDPNVPRLNSAAPIVSAPPAAAAAVEESGAPESKYPLGLPALDLDSQDLQHVARTPLQPHQITTLRRNPDRLMDEIFISEAGEFYQVSSIMMSKRAKFFYLTFADEGEEAVCYTYEDFFSLLSSSSKVGEWARD
ncbi:hypothetical protein R3P38DRAFT_3352494 [Favolaschia claudopus]|uniref:Uncharacterized protein n=1 Tax=Favolaschia claudopus TaxID=2862362 RepID=A0AAW0C2S3_9AGAR